MLADIVGVFVIILILACLGVYGAAFIDIPCLEPDDKKDDDDTPVFSASTQYEEGDIVMFQGKKQRIELVPDSVYIKRLESK